MMVVATRYRTFWHRFWASGVDALLFSPLYVAEYWQCRQELPVGARVAWYTLLAIAGPAYVIYCHGRFGQTLGKRLLRIKVLDVGGGPLRFGQAVRRELLNLPGQVWGFAVTLLAVLQGVSPYAPEQLQHAPPIALEWSWFALELVTMLTNAKRRSLHDFLAGSVVVRINAPEATRSSVLTSAECAPDLRSEPTPSPSRA